VVEKRLGAPPVAAEVVRRLDLAARVSRRTVILWLVASPPMASPGCSTGLVGADVGFPD